MSKALKILSVAVILFLAYMWVSILLKSCNKSNDREDQYFEETVNNDKQVDEFDSDEFGDEKFFEDKQEDAIDYDQLDQKVVETKKDLAEEPVKKEPIPVRRVSTSSEGDYMVIAGNYLLEENADKMVRKLQGYGFNEAEKVIFDQSQFHAVCAGRLASYNSAVELSRKVKNKGIEAYVHKRK